MLFSHYLVQVLGTIYTFKPQVSFYRLILKGCQRIFSYRMLPYLNYLSSSLHIFRGLQCTVWIFALYSVQCTHIDNHLSPGLLPSKGHWYYLNPGPFNIKEHTCIVIMSSTAATVATAMEIIAALSTSQKPTLIFVFINFFVYLLFPQIYSTMYVWMAQ